MLRETFSTILIKGGYNIEYCILHTIPKVLVVHEMIIINTFMSYVLSVHFVLFKNQLKQRNEL
jgi:hypothetical protein